MLLYIVISTCIIFIGCMFVLSGQKKRLEELEKRIDTQNKDLAQMRISINRMRRAQ